METKDKCITSESLKYVHDKVYDDLYGEYKEVWNVIPEQTVQFQLSDSGMYFGSIDVNDYYPIESLPAIHPTIDGKVCDGVKLQYNSVINKLMYMFHWGSREFVLFYDSDKESYVLVCSDTSLESCTIEASCYFNDLLPSSASTINMIKLVMSQATAPRIVIDILSETITIDGVDYQAQIGGYAAPLGDPRSVLDIAEIIYYITELKRPITAIINRPDGSVFQSQASVQNGALLITYLYNAGLKLCADEIMFNPNYNTQYGIVKSFNTEGSEVPSAN